MKIQPFRLERYFARYEFNVPYLLSSSDCESLSVGDLLALEPDAREQFEALWLGYTESEGSPGLRQEIAGLYRFANPGQILVFAGAEEAIFVAMSALFQPGDHLIVHAPCYQSLMEVARANGCQVTAWQTYPENGWQLDPEVLRKSIRSNTKGVIVNCPHNPTGYLMSAEIQQAVITVVREHGLLLFSDEVYRGLEHDPQARLEAACDLYENALSLGVMSKTYGLAGLRIGWLVTQNPEVRARLATFKDYTSICNSAPSEYLSTLALRHRTRLTERNLAIILANLDLLDTFFERHRKVFEWQRPRASSIAFPRLALDRPIEDFCDDLAAREGVMLLPGTCYEANSQHFRIGFGRKNMPEALARLEHYLTTV